MLPDGGMRAMLAVAVFSIGINGFTGSLPVGGMRAMLAVTIFSIGANGFTGSLPAGMLPAGLFVEAVPGLYLYDNFFAGTVAESLLLPHESKPWPPPKLFGG
eukprot:376578-Amphidinium_carterae.2